jgi:hypothetical protein
LGEDGTLNVLLGGKHRDDNRGGKKSDERMEPEPHDAAHDNRNADKQ